jgi:heterodisulfide reductase subunit B2
MDFAIQRCCVTPIYLKSYNSSTDAILKAVDIGLVDIEEFNCCGYPLKDIDQKAHVLASARNLSLAEKRSLDVMTFCNCCYESLREAKQLMGEDESLKKDVNGKLMKEGLEYGGTTGIRHLLDVLYHDVGLKALKEKVVKPFKGLKIAVHYGCHIIRPKQLVEFDDPGTAEVFDQLVEITGAEIVPWEAQLDCCGAPVWGIDDDLSMDLTQKKTRNARESGADYLCVACAYGQIQFDRVQKIMLSKRGEDKGLPSILLTQLLGLSLGLDSDVLGIAQNELDADGITRFLSPEESLTQSYNSSPP